LLNKEICKRCHCVSKFWLESEWREEDENFWKQGFVLCEKVGSSFLDNIYGGEHCVDSSPPDDCIYFTEQIVVGDENDG